MLFWAYLLAFCRAVLILVFSFSFISKIRNVTAFEQSIINFGILPQKLSRLAAIFFLSIEFSVASLLLVGSSFLVLGFFIAVVALIIFCAAITFALVRNLQISCNCFGTSANEKSLSLYEIVRNLSFIACALCGLASVMGLTKESITLNLEGSILMGIVAITFVMIATHFKETIQLFKEFLRN